MKITSSLHFLSKMPMLDFDGIKIPHYNDISSQQWKAGLEAALHESQTLWQEAKDCQDPTTFDNVFGTLERSRNRLMIDLCAFSLLVDGGDQQAMEIHEQLAGLIAEQNVRQMSDPVMAKRAQEALDEAKENHSFAPNELRAAEQWVLATKLTGALLDTDEQRKELADINGRCAELQAKFQRLCGDACDSLAWFDPKELPGVALEVLQKRDDGNFGVRMVREPVEEILNNCSDRDTRQRVFHTFEQRGTPNGLDGVDTGSTIKELMRLREEKAKLLGFSNFAALRLANTMAKDEAHVLELIERTKQAVEPAVKAVLDRLEAMAKEDGLERLEPWDTFYYLAKTESQQVEDKPQKPTLQQTRGAAFKLAEDLFGIEFTQIQINGPWEGMTTWHVAQQGKKIGSFITDYSARTGKPNGAWMHLLQEGHTMGEGQYPVVSNSCNFGDNDDSYLLSQNDVCTFFHEFGHALHGLLGRTEFPSQSGTNTLHDWVELPSQLLENWARDPECAAAIGLPAGAGGHGGGAREQIGKLRYLYAAGLDMAIHMGGLQGMEVQDFENKCLAEMGQDSRLSAWHHLANFSHLFSSEDYAAGYYGYLWAAVLDADVFNWAKNQEGGAMDRETGRALEKYLYASGDTQAPEKLFHQLTGRPTPNPDALAERLGVGAQKAKVNSGPKP